MAYNKLQLPSIILIKLLKSICKIVNDNFVGIW